MMDESVFTQDDELLPEQKHIWLVVAGQGGGETFKDLIVGPNTDAYAILEQVGLAEGYVLRKPDEGVFQMHENVYPFIESEYQKFHARKDDVTIASFN